MAFPVLPVVAGAVTSAVSSAFNKVSQHEQREYDYRRLVEERAYNSPAQQSKRLRQAGINPALALTNGVMSSGNVDQSGGGQQPVQYDFSPIAQGVNTSVDLAQQRRLQDSQIYKTNMEANNQAIRNRYENTRQIVELSKLLSEKGLTDETKKRISEEIKSLQLSNKWIDENNASNLRYQDAMTQKAHEEAETERVMREVNKRAVEQGIRLSKSQQSFLVAQTKQCYETVNQMVLNGASQREINSFIRDKEREAARQLFKGNENYQKEFESRMNLMNAETKKYNREHSTNTFSFFGIPLGTRESITDYGSKVPYSFERFETNP